MGRARLTALERGQSSIAAWSGSNRSPGGSSVASIARSSSRPKSPSSDRMAIDRVDRVGGRPRCAGRAWWCWCRRSRRARSGRPSSRPSRSWPTVRWSREGAGRRRRGSRPVRPVPTTAVVAARRAGEDDQREGRVEQAVGHEGGAHRRPDARAAPGHRPTRPAPRSRLAARRPIAPHLRDPYQEPDGRCGIEVTAPGGIEQDRRSPRRPAPVRSGHGGGRAASATQGDSDEVDDVQGPRWAV